MTPPAGPRLAALAQRYLDTPPSEVTVRDLAVMLALAWAAAKMKDTGARHP